MSRVDFGAKPWVFPMPVLIVGTYDENGNTILICFVANLKYSSSDGGRYYKLDNRSDEDDIKMIELLLNHGADINAKTKDCGNDDELENE